MKVREMINTIIEKGNREDMYKLHDMLDKLICDLKEEKPKMYHEYKEELYVLAYGKVITEEKAIEIVSHMLPYGEHYSLDEASMMKDRYSIKHNKVDVYLVINSLYNDYCDIFGDDNELYAKMTKSWLNDIDGKEDKVYLYFTKIPKGE